LTHKDTVVYNIHGDDGGQYPLHSFLTQILMTKIEKSLREILMIYLLLVAYNDRLAFTVKRFLPASGGQKAWLGAEAAFCAGSGDAGQQMRQDWKVGADDDEPSVHGCR
jgi:hypothetical protein